MSEREGTATDFARMMRGEQPQPEQEAEPSTENEGDLFRVPSMAEKREADRRFVASMHPPGDEAA